MRSILLVTCLIGMDPFRVHVYSRLASAHPEWTSADRFLKSHAHSAPLHSFGLNRTREAFPGTLLLVPTLKPLVGLFGQRESGWTRVFATAERERLVWELIGFYLCEKDFKIVVWWYLWGLFERLNLQMEWTPGVGFFPHVKLSPKWIDVRFCDHWIIFLFRSFCFQSDHEYSMFWNHIHVPPGFSGLIWILAYYTKKGY